METQETAEAGIWSKYQVVFLPFSSALIQANSYPEKQQNMSNGSKFVNWKPKHQLTIILITQTLSHSPYLSFALLSPCVSFAKFPITCVMKQSQLNKTPWFMDFHSVYLQTVTILLPIPKYLNCSYLELSSSNVIRSGVPIVLVDLANTLLLSDPVLNAYTCGAFNCFWHADWNVVLTAQYFPIFVNKTVLWVRRNVLILKVYRSDSNVSECFFTTEFHAEG